MRVTIDTTELRGCKVPGCGKFPVYRHHKGCDNFIGKHNRIVRLQYKLFLDCVDVCDKHHMIIHFMYWRIIRGWTNYTPTGALELRAKLIAYCDEILAGKIKLERPTKLFRKKWARRRRLWLKKQAARKAQQ